MKQTGAKEGIVWMVVGVVICILSWRIDLGSFREPGAGFVAFISGVSLVVIGAIMSLSKGFSRPGSKTPPASQPPLKLRKARLAYTLALLVAYSLVLNALGYIVTSIVVLFGLFYDRGTNRFLPSALGSVLTVVLTYLIFDTWLQVQLPRGILPWW
jgi:putative tricarboxylic transport membrane protein